MARMTNKYQCSKHYILKLPIIFCGAKACNY